MARSTRDITQSNALASGLVAGAIGAGLLVYAALYTQAAWNFAQAEPRYREIERGKAATVVELDALTQALRASPSDADLSRAAFVQMLTAQQLGLRSLRAVGRLTSARRDLRRGVTATPTDAFAWMRLAVTELHLSHPKAAALAYSNAVQLAPMERKLIPMQLDLAVVLWPQLSRSTKALIEQRMTWAAGSPELRQALEGNSAKAIRARLKDELGEP